MIIYQLSDPALAIATNPKSGVTSTAHLLEIIGVSFLRLDMNNKQEFGALFSSIESSALVFRDPYARAVSMYLRFCRSLVTPNYSKRLASEEILKALDRSKSGISFIEFLQYLIDTPVNRLNLHYWPQQLPDHPHITIRTEYFKTDMLTYFQSVKFQKGIEKLMLLTEQDLKKNITSESRPDIGADASEMISSDILAMSAAGFPNKQSFLNDTSTALIQTLFAEEIAYQVNLGFSKPE